ncbi:MAG: hypothetical protein ACYTEL_05425 [Planctomycetota bacterium]|jgi:hypothetical protein
MNISKYKDFIKSYSSLLVPIVIGITGALLLIPTQLMGGKLKERMTRESLDNAETLERYSRSGTLSNGQWQVEYEYQLAHGADANGIELLARQSTQRQLLSYGIFPEPKDNSVLIFRGFGRQFRAAVEGLVADVNAGSCPTTAQLNDIIKSNYTMKSGRRSRGAREVEAAIRDGLCLQNAKSCSVYANPAVLDIYNFWDKYKYADAQTRDESIQHCWYSQLAYWIIEDVFRTIETMNTDSKTVLTSPVKRLMNVSFPANRAVRGVKVPARGAKKSGDDKPSYVIALEQLLGSSLTRRVSNKDMDVVHFETTVILDSAAVTPFMRQLCSAKAHSFTGWDGNGPEQISKHNQITILEYTISAVDREDVEHEHYCYGDDAVVELKSTCEYLFHKAGYKEILPPAVTKDIDEIQEAIGREQALRNRKMMFRMRGKVK